MNRRFLQLGLGSLLLVLVGAGTARGQSETPEIPVDPRRDATVVAVERVMPSVVNIATRTWVEREHPYERLWRQYYGDRKSVV